MAKFTGHTITSDSALGDAKIQRSLRFDSGSSAHLTRAVTTTGNRKIWTFSCWVKKAENGYKHRIYSCNNANTGYVALYFHENNDQLYSYFHPGNNYGSVSDRRFRDTTSWMHIVHQVDATNTVQRIWINGEELSLNSSRNPGNSDYPMNQSGITLYIGRASWSSTEANHANMYLAEVYLVDGSLIAPTDFGFTDPVTNIWMPKRYEGTYGTNGFYLDFGDNSSTAALGIDKSPNGNDFTLNNFSVSAGAGNDSLEDTPTNNFCTLNAGNKDGQTTLSNGSLQAAGSQTSTYNINTQGTFAQSSGKWYYEVEFTSGSGSCAVGWVRTSMRYSDNPTTGGGIIYRPTSGDYCDLAGNNPTTPPTTSTGTVIQVAIDFDAGKIWFGSGGTYFESGNPSTGANAAMTFTGGAELLTPVVRTMAATFNFNFGQRPFSYTVPTGYKTLETRNLPPTTPSIIRPQRHFDTLLYTGNNTDDTNITGLEFKPDFVWIKERSGSEPNLLFNSVQRGLTAHTFLNSNLAAVEANDPNALQSFNKDGFQIGTSSELNANSETYAAWCWKAGGTAVSNTDGSITSSVSANQEAGFSICGFTINTSGVYTVGHGLGKAPDWIMMKNRDTTNNWDCYHVSVGNTKRLKLNSSDTPEDYTEPWNDTTPTSSVFTSTGSWLGGSGNKIIAYCWTSIPGYSKMGGYTGNGSSDGVYVNIGFKPAWLLVKDTSTSENWRLFDNKRNTFNQVNKHLFPSNANAESTETGLDFLSSGFKFRDGDAHQNGNGNTYIYIAFAEQPGTTPFDTFPNAR